MSVAIQCPSCRTKLNVGDTSLGKSVRCPSCAAILKVPAKTSSGDGAASAVMPARAPAIEREAIVSAEKRPASSPQPRREADASPARRKAGQPLTKEADAPKGKTARPWILAGVAAGCGLLVLGLGAVGLVTAFLLKGKSDEGPKQVAQVTTLAEQKPIEQRPQPAPPQPVVGPPPVKAPDGPIPAQLDAAMLGKVKQATVFLRVNLPNGDIAEGSGFFTLVPGIIITNAHVLGMLRGDSTPPVRVDVVARSGEPNEKKMVGTVLGVDRSNDLAVLRVQGEGLPAPLAVDSAGKLFETQKVYIFGFPLGSELGKAITVSESSVSSLRRDASGQLSQVQVNGGMHHGNSGGPVTDARGTVVGVSVSGYEGTQLNFAIPGDLVKQVLDGRFGRSELGLAYQSDNQVKLPMKMTCLDPLNRIRQVKVEMWTGPAGANHPPSTKQPEPLPGDGPRTTIPAVFQGGAHLAEVPLPKPAPGQVYWFQPVLVKDGGETQWAKAFSVPVESQVVVDRKPALLQFKPPGAPIERTLKAQSAVTLTIYKGKRSLSLSEKMDGKVLESLNPDPRGIGTFIRLTLGACPFTRGTAGKLVGSPPQTQAILSQFSPTFLVNAENACKERGKRNFGGVAAPYRDTVEHMYETMCNTYESTTLPLPNRMVQPLETWPARIPIFVVAHGKARLLDIFATCTYEGIRSVAGHNEAYIRLTGEVKGRGARASTVLGKAHGHAQFDIEKGFLTFAQLTVNSELESEESGLRILVNDDSIIQRSEGNLFGIRAATRNQPGGAPGPRRPLPRRK
ncbi:MAG TPA: trypsin-like peptidase domain-containing protein [Gemmataceae bacterium]|nr:trypsin-like peptidase domain-containing protein [Gemmataceae bacterium]